MNLRNFISVSALLLNIFLFSCSGRPSQVMSDGKTVDVLSDIYIAEAYLESSSNHENNDSVRKVVMAGVLRNHGVSQEELDSTLSWYGRNMDVFHELFARIEKKIDQKQRKTPGLEKVAEDINDFWPYSRHTMLLDNGATNNLMFSLPSSLTPGERVEWKFRLTSPTEGKILLGVDYEDGSSSYVNKSLYGDRKVSVSLQTDTARKTKRIFGNFLLNEELSLPVFIDSISLRNMALDSVIYFRIHSQRNYFGPRRKLPKPSQPADSLSDDSDLTGVKKKVLDQEVATDMTEITTDHLGMNRM